MSYYLKLSRDDRRKFELINRILNTVRKAAGKPLVHYLEIEKAPFGTGNSAESNNI